MRGRRFAASAALAATGLAAPLVTAWLFWRDGGWDTYRAPLFLPFLFAAGLMVRFSLSSMTADPRSWRSFVARAAAGAAAVAAGAACRRSRAVCGRPDPRQVRQIRRCAAGDAELALEHA